MYLYLYQTTYCCDFDMYLNLALLMLTCLFYVSKNWFKKFFSKNYILILIIVSSVGDDDSPWNNFWDDFDHVSFGSFINRWLKPQCGISKAPLWCYPEHVTSNIRKWMGKILIFLCVMPPEEPKALDMGISKITWELVA